MHTLMVMGGGFVLLGLCLLAGKIAGGWRKAMIGGLLIFLPLWLLSALVNMWVGVTQAGYSVGEELPVFVVVKLCVEARRCVEREERYIF